MSITSIVEDSGSSPSGVTGEPVDYSMLHFTATYDDESTGSVIPSSCTPDPFGDTTGTIPVTFSFAGTDVTCIVNYEVEEPAAPVLESLSVSGSFTNLQYTGSAPDLAGLSFTATYDDESTKSVSASDIVCTPSVWDASGNPNNLGAQNVVFTYTEDGNSASTGINGTVIHRPSEQSLTIGTAGHVYFDMTAEMATSPWSGPTEILGGTVASGERAGLVLSQAEYTDPTATVDYTKFAGWLSSYGVVTSATGTPNTAGFIPEFGWVTNDYSELSDLYVAASINDQGSATTSDTFYIVFGTLANSVTGSYCLNDLNSEGRIVYQVNLNAPV